jgi:YHS domain-containing protein/mono/diheme cytochrome c family protein
MVLHLPIGLLAGLAAIELLFLRSDNAERARPTRTLIAYLAALSAIIATISGYFLGRSGDYDPTTLDRHFYLGIAVAVLSCLTAFAQHARGAATRRLFLILTLGALFPAGHLGAAMTHGEDFLLAPLRAKPTDQSATQPVLTRFAAEVRPILETRCVSCHGPSKAKGGLRLDSPEQIEDGGMNGPILLAGDPSASELIRRLHLPEDDDERMPPPGKTPLTPQQIEILEAWIRDGASFTEPPRGTPADPTQISDTGQQPSANPTPAQRPMPPAEALAAVTAALGHASPTSLGEPTLLVSFPADPHAIDDAKAAELLKPLAPFIAELSLARTRITDATLPLLAEMPELRKLDLRETSLTSAGLAPLARSSSLEELNLVRTKLDPSSIESLAALAPLRRVYVWGAGLDKPTLDALRERRKDLSIEAGDALSAEQLAAEEKVTFSSDAPPVGGDHAKPAPTDLSTIRPINSVCPVSGTPVKPEFTILYKGKAIGFCCPNCPKGFWENPDKYLAIIEGNR